MSAAAMDGMRKSSNDSSEQYRGIRALLRQNATNSSPSGIGSHQMGQLEAMLISMATEGFVAFALVAWRGWPCRGPLHVALAAGVATAATHPQLWSASLWLYPRLGYEPTVVLAETVVIVVEASIIWWATQLQPTRALLVSAVANSASVLVGLGLALVR